MEYILDLQGFRRSSNLFVLKEAALIPVEKDALPSVYLFQAPCKWSQLLSEEQCTNRWLESSFHGIPWSSGKIPYSNLIRVLQVALGNATKVYVKGLEKKKWLQEMVPGKLIFNLEDMGCPSLKEIRNGEGVSCRNHPLCWNFTCAVKNAYAIRNWLLEKRVYVPEEEGEDEVDCPCFEPQPMIHKNYLSMYC